VTRRCGDEAGPGGSALRDLVVAPVGPDGTWRLADAGFPRAAGTEGLGVVNPDRDSVLLDATRVASSIRYC
jgi:hypothetical protein